MGLYNLLIKLITNKILISLFLLVFISCNTSKSVFTESPPFEIEKVFVNNEPNVSEIIIAFNKLPETVEISKIHFQNKVEKPTFVESSDNKFKIRFSTHTNWNLSNIPEEEAKNKIPVKSDFNLDENQIIIEYFYLEKKYFYKTSIEQKAVD